MNPNKSLVFIALSASVLSGCIAKTAANIITAPVRVASKAVDLATTSQSEADENRGRDLRERDAELGGLDRDYRRYSRKCDRGSRSACRKAERTRIEIQELKGDEW